MANTVIGKILTIGDTVNVSKTGEFLKRELVLDLSRYDRYTGEPLPNYAAMNFYGKNCELLEGYKEGELVEITFALKGREWESGGIKKYITEVEGYKVERKGNLKQTQNISPKDDSESVQENPQQHSTEGNTQGDLPF